jgi:hypothetical protein
MEIEFWWLLSLPLFFALGWFAARIDIKQLVSESRALPKSYFRGLNFLLNEQPDQAIEAFIEVVKVDPQTIELHFALGSLFRRRGEVERAIRMHPASVLRQEHAGAGFNPFQGSAGGVRVLREKPRGSNVSMLGQPRHLVGIQMDDLVIAAAVAGVTGIGERAVACIARLL